jgi:hypothetical protein
MEIKDLKVIAYDTMAQIEYLQAQLQQVNQTIAQELAKQKQAAKPAEAPQAPQAPQAALEAK